MRPLVLLTLLAACAGSTPPIADPVADHKTPAGDPVDYASPHLGTSITLLPGVFPPQEAEGYVLPFMTDHKELFAGKRVYEIGTGSGLISLYAAQLGAAKVVCTDISPIAIECVRRNAERLGVTDRVEARLVPASDMSAYSVLRPGEVFDTIISNPPYSLDLDASHNTALVDNGDLGFSIVRGLPRHLAKDGTVALFYATLFFHDVMEKFAVHCGYEVRGHTAMGMAPWELEPLFNMYLRRLLVSEGLPPDAFRFYKDQLPYATVVDNRAPHALVGELMPEGAPPKTFRGFLTIRNKAR